MAKKWSKWSKFLSGVGKIDWLATPEDYDAIVRKEKWLRDEASKAIVQVALAKGTSFENVAMSLYNYGKHKLTEQGYFAFADQALAERRAAGLPPFCHLALLRAEAHKPGQAEGFLEEACAEAERLQAQLGSDVELLGPVPAPMERRAGRFRAQLLLMSSARVPLHRLLSCWLPILESMPGGRQVRWSLDVDPIDLF